MHFIYFLKGVLIGFFLAVPIGPVALLCIRRTLKHGVRYGLVTGVSSAFCDMVNGGVAAFGVTLISDFITRQQYWIRLVGGVILLALGYATFRARPHTDKLVKAPRGHAWAFSSTALLVFTNPVTLFAYAAALTFIGAKDIVGHSLASLALVVGVFFGSLTWFVLLTGLVHFFKEKVTRVGLPLVNRVTGALLILCGLLALLAGIRGV